METGAKPPTGEGPRATAPADTAERLDGLRAWVAVLDRKLGVRFYALAAAAILALAAGITALILALGLEEDSATKSDVKRLRDQVAGVEKSASQAAQDNVAELDERVSGFESQLRSLRSDQSSTERELSVAQDDISELRRQISELRRSQNSSQSD